MPPPRQPPPRPAPAGLWFDALLIAGFAGITVALIYWPPLLQVDLAVRDWVDAHRPPPVYVLMRVLDYLGQGAPFMILTLAIGFVLAWRYRTVRPIIPAGLAPIFTTGTIVPLKIYTERGAPHYGPVELFSGPGNVEYPSGHVNNALVYFATMAMLLSPWLPVAARRTLQWLPGPLAALGTTYLAFHWFTDSVAGYLLGLLLARLMLRVPWRSMPLPRMIDRGRPPARTGNARSGSTQHADTG